MKLETLITILAVVVCALVGLAIVFSDEDAQTTCEKTHSPEVCAHELVR